MYQATTFSPAYARAFAQGFPLRQRLREDKPAGAVGLRPAGKRETVTKVHLRFVFRSSRRQGYGRQAIDQAVSWRRLNEIWPSYLFTAPYASMGVPHGVTRFDLSSDMA